MEKGTQKQITNFVLALNGAKSGVRAETGLKSHSRSYGRSIRRAGKKESTKKDGNEWSAINEYFLVFSIAKDREKVAVNLSHGVCRGGKSRCCALLWEGEKREGKGKEEIVKTTPVLYCIGGKEGHL